MAKTVSYSRETDLGCGLSQLRRANFPRKPSLPTSISNIAKLRTAKTSNNSIEKPRSGARVNDSSLAKPPTKTGHELIKKPTAIHPRPSEAARSSTSSSNAAQAQDLADEHKLKEPNGTSAELTTHQQSNHESKAPVPATSSNVTISGQLGNLRLPGTGRRVASNSPDPTVKDHRHSYGMMGNIVKQSGYELRANRSDPEAVKAMGNEAYMRGSFEEALAFYDRAIALDSRNATYRNNRSAALMGLGRLIDAVAECKETIRIDPSYRPAHHRLANLYLRLGEAEKALCHYDQLGSTVDMSKALSLEKHLTSCNHARRFEEWSNLLQDTQHIVSAGADSAPLVYAMQVEALMKLHRHQEAYAVFQQRPNFEINSCTKLLGHATSAYLLMVASMVYLTSGRFEDSVEAAQHAARLDPTNSEVSMVVNKVRAVSSARTCGNLLFKTGKYSEACAAYNEGLEHDRYNSVLLCNRAACRAKLGQLEEAVEDCTAALSVRPSYSKARLRRADCYSKMKRWEASIQDYQMLRRVSPGEDEDVRKGLHEAQLQLREQLGGEDMNEIKYGSNLVVIYSSEHFRNLIASPGMCVVLFCDKTKEKQVLKPLQQVCKRFASVNFLKVDVEEHPCIAKSEGVSSVPAFKIYKNGLQVKELQGNNCELLESSVRVYSS